MKMTFRWYGEGNDRIKLSDIKQIPGVEGIVFRDDADDFHGRTPNGKKWVKMKKTIVLFKRMNIEFEYVYYNGDLDIDRIVDMQSRKRIFSTNIQDMEVIAPTDSVELHPYQRLKVLDCSTKNPEDKTYELVTLFKGAMVKVIFNPNEKILNGMKNMAPRKVFI